jgi:GDP-L-fucose synthase
VSIADLAKTIADVAGFKGQFVFDHSKPDGTPRKLIDSTRLRKMGWRPHFDLRRGLQQVYAWYRRAAGAADRRLRR